MTADLTKLPENLRRIAEAALVDKSGGRNSGRTLRMALNLREDSWVVVHNSTMRDYVLRAIDAFRSDLGARRMRPRIVIIARRQDVQNLRGLRGSLEVDHTARAYMDSETWASMREIWSRPGSELRVWS